MENDLEFIVGTDVAESNMGPTLGHDNNPRSTVLLGLGVTASRRGS